MRRVRGFVFRWNLWKQLSNRGLLMAILVKQEIIMAKIDELQAALDSISPTIDAISADQAGLVDEIKALKEQVASGSVATEAQLQSALDAAMAVKARLDAVDASVPAKPVV